MDRHLAKPFLAEGIFVVRNDRGLHTRPSTEIVKCAASFSSEIKLHYERNEVNAKSLLGILMLAAEKGAKIRVMARGGDAQEALEALVSLAEKKFNIPY